VTGLITPVYKVARILHRHNALAFFDYAAIAPYAPILLCHGEDCFLDGIFFSPHKLLGGPGSSGILIIHERVYRYDLPPTVGAGGTVEFVNAEEQKYSAEIEVREKPGTPGILQTLRASLALELKERLGPERIEAREAELTRRALERLGSHPAVQIIGNPDPARRIAILSFNIRLGDSYLHPRFVTLLLNDLFGIQSRAGCSCAGPYGHRLLHIDSLKSQVQGDARARGVKRARRGNFHFLMSDAGSTFSAGPSCSWPSRAVLLPLPVRAGHRRRRPRVSAAGSGLRAGRSLADLPGGNPRRSPKTRRQSRRCTTVICAARRLARELEPEIAAPTHHGKGPYPRVLPMKLDRLRGFTYITMVQARSRGSREGGFLDHSTPAVVLSTCVTRCSWPSPGASVINSIAYGGISCIGRASTGS
jgi:hypothetical protein